MRLIDADALMMSLADWWCSSFGEQETEEAKAIHAVMDKVEEYIQSSAQPEPRWISMTERLPEDEQNVLVTYKTTDKIHPCQYHDDGSRNPWYSYIDQCRAHMNVVLAWMPLPEPYKEKKNGE